MKIKQIFAVLAVSASLMSCNFLDEFDPNATTAGNFYTSEADIETSLNGVYQSLAQSYYYQYNYYFTDVRAHVTVVTDSGASSGIPYQFYNYTLTEENQYVYNRYTQLFKSISRVNTLLSHLDDVTYSASEARDTYEAEARFVRALTYFHLVTEWGDVPLVLERLDSKDEVAANNYRRPKAQIYKAIFDDLDFVLDSPLADFQPASECGRASKAAALALYGKAALQCACDEDFASEKSSYLTTAIEKLTSVWGCVLSASCRKFPTTRSGTSPRRSPAPRTSSRSTTCREMPISVRSGTTSSAPARRASPPIKSARCTT